MTAYDTASYLGTLLLVLASALVACAVPAYRAARIDPLRALRG